MIWGYKTISGIPKQFILGGAALPRAGAKHVLWSSVGQDVVVVVVLVGAVVVVVV